MDKFINQVVKTMERIDQLVMHFVLCENCSKCVKQDRIIQSCDNITGELRRSLRNRKATLLPAEPLYKESQPVLSRKQVFPWWGKESVVESEDELSS